MFQVCRTESQVEDCRKASGNRSNALYVEQLTEQCSDDVVPIVFATLYLELDIEVCVLLQTKPVLFPNQYPG